MQSSSIARQQAASVQPTRNLLQTWIRNPVALLILGSAIVIAGLASGWSWLTALGIAPIILSAAPCLVMCALGMCMMGKANKSGAPQQTTQSTEPPISASLPGSPND